MRATPGRSGGIITLDRADEVMVVGDLHGNLPAFKKVLAIAALDRHPRRHLVLQELVHGPHSYPDDKGDRSHQLVDLVAALKCQYPDRVHLILGNHELSELTGRSIGKDGEGLNAKFRRGIETAYGPDRRRDLRRLQGALRRAAAGGPDGESGVSLPHDPRRNVISTRSTSTCSRPTLAGRGDEAARNDLRAHLGARHHRRDRRPLRRHGRRRLLHHRPPALR